ncbi:MAG: DNA polymerase III subunit delta' [gamma proteobacterium symbiont of Bathyaustriella thionipta]|nr:DNA polymerase III subunit delta' [gamma proteobacterium symbiont of Bathyaustriella thionipta]
MTSSILPWQQPLWQNIQQVRQRNRLPHALLLTGHAGIGKAQFAAALAAALLCEKPLADATACGQCTACKQRLAGTMPDYRVLPSDTEKKLIPVSDVRALIEWMAIRSDAGRPKTVIIHQAENMNRSAANALLKILEEPYSDSLIMLLTAAPQFLPVTIRSRCQNLAFSLPEFDTSLRWLEQQKITAAAELLQMTEGAPLHALAFASSRLPEEIAALQTGFVGLLRQSSSPMQLAAEWEKQDLQRSLQWICRQLAMMACSQVASGYKQGLHHDLQQIAKTLDYKTLINMYDKTCDSVRLARGNVNARLLLEDLLLNFVTRIT